MGKKVILSGLLAGFLMLIVGFAVSFVFQIFFPELMGEYTSKIFRPWTDPLMMLYFLHPFLMGVVFAWAWDLTKVKFKGTVWQRGFNFGVFVWAIAVFPGMFITYSSFMVSLTMIISWTVMGFVNAIVAGWVFAKLNK